MLPLPSYLVTAEASSASAAPSIKTIIEAPLAGAGKLVIDQDPDTVACVSGWRTPFTATAIVPVSPQSVDWSYASQVPETVISSLILMKVPGPLTLVVVPPAVAVIVGTALERPVVTGARIANPPIW